MIDTSGFKDIYPFSSNWLEIGNLRYHYIDEGPRDAPVILMVHGNPTWSFYYRTLIHGLKDNYRIIAPDHIGCGLSDKPQDYDYTIQQHIDNLESLVSHLNLKEFVVACHDWGGAISFGYAINYPENVKAFVIFNTAAFSFPKVPKRIKVCRPNKLGGFFVRRLNLFNFRTIVYMRGVKRDRITPAIKAGYLAPYNNSKNRIAIHRFVQEIPVESDHPNHSLVDKLEANLPLLKNHPMIIFWGAKDFCFTEREVLPVWKSHFPDAEVHVFKDAGHFVVEDAYEEILPLMEEFLEKIID